MVTAFPRSTGRSLRGNVDRNDFDKLIVRQLDVQVVPYVGTWIEICLPCPLLSRLAVVPYVGTWIEILDALEDDELEDGRSLRGNVDRNVSPDVWTAGEAGVVPYVGTWIEIGTYNEFCAHHTVVPYVGTWIEILRMMSIIWINGSFPTWERG